MAPPELAREDPGAQVAHPLEVHARPPLRHEPHLAALDHLDRGLRELVHPHEPLQAYERLDPLPGAMRERDRVAVGLLEADAPLRAKGLHDGPPRLDRRQPDESLRRRVVKPPVLTDHHDLLEPVGAPDLEVVRIVAGGDLERSGAELRVDVLVDDDREAPADERKDAVAADEAPIALVVGMDRHRGVGEHRLRANGRDAQRIIGAHHRVVDPVQRVGDLAVLDLEVGDRRARSGIPVDHVVVAVDVALLVQRDEHLVDRADVGLVEREALALVVARGAEPLVLLDDL